MVLEGEPLILVQAGQPWQMPSTPSTAFAPQLVPQVASPLSGSVHTWPAGHVVCAQVFAWRHWWVTGSSTKPGKHVVQCPFGESEQARFCERQLSVEQLAGTSQLPAKSV